MGSVLVRRICFAAMVVCIAAFFACSAPASKTGAEAAHTEASAAATVPAPTPATAPTPTPAPTPTAIPDQTVFGETVSPGQVAFTVPRTEADEADVLATLTQTLPMLPSLRTVDLTLWQPVLSPETICTLQQRFPAVTFEYAFTLFDRTFRTTDTEIDLFKVRVRDEGVPALTEVLACMPACTYADMALTGVHDETMAALAEAFPNIRFSWMVSFGQYRCRTDANMLKASVPEKAFDSADADVLRYCTKLQYVDVGHNELTDLSFLSDMRDVSVLIAAISHHVTDISPLAELTKLEYLELFTNDISDISPLAELTELRYLNLCNNEITDASPLYGLEKLERLWISMNPLSAEQQAELRERLPNCEINFTTANPTGEGWRKHPRYDLLSEQFLYGSGTIFVRFDREEPR